VSSVVNARAANGAMVDKERLMLEPILKLSRADTLVVVAPGRFIFSMGGQSGFGFVVR